MCAIGRDQDSSIGASAPASAMLGAGAIGASVASKRRTLLTSPAGSTGSGAGGTLLAPTPGGGNNSGGSKPILQR